jgi:hypothetical protein
MSKHDGGKGDAPRPLGVSMEVFDRNFDAIFKKKEKEHGNDNTQGSPQHNLRGQGEDVRTPE